MDFTKHLKNTALISRIEYQDQIIETQKQIIKELGEALIKANLYVPPKFYGQGEAIDNEDYQTIQTTLDKYKNYL